jgi:uncharacterized protein YcfL
MNVKAFSVGLALFGLFGCASNGLDAHKNSCPSNMVRLVNSPDISVAGSTCQIKDGYLRVSVDVQSEYSQERTLSYRFDWFGVDGSLLGREESWKPIYFYKGELKTIRSIAPSEEVVEFRFLIKE